MDIKKFVRDTLIQISSGVKEAQDAVRENGGFVNPAARVAAKGDSNSHLVTIDNGQGVFFVDFDVAVTVTDETSNEGEAKLKIASIFSAGGGVTNASEASSTSRISFKVPLALPVDEVSQSKMLQKEEQSRARVNQSLRTSGNCLG
ncbi:MULTISPECIES: hypothetical protein [unclassified Microbulbifer]|uniref:hypothetical protein n=1 Tax=unclassified Microbulbifer TaxID=2619833 RepID=UPI0027E458A1|nr:MULTISPECIES: hypothetical protein [unclassified Microbulbifer]